MCWLGSAIGGYSIWQAYDQHRVKPLGELFLAVLCVAIGIWDFPAQAEEAARGLKEAGSRSKVGATLHPRGPGPRRCATLPFSPPAA